VLVKGDRVEHALIGDTYYSGTLPLWTWVKWSLSGQPGLLIIFLMLASMVAATILFRYLRRKAAQRLALSDAKE